MVKSRSNYKCLVRKNKYNYDSEQTKILEHNRLLDAKRYWNLLKGSVKPCKSDKLKTDDFFRYFKSINDPDTHFYQPDEDILYFNERYLNEEFQVMFDDLNIEISQDEIKKACKSLKNGKSAGPDYVLNEFLKHGVTNESFLRVLHLLFNKMFDIGYFPEA